MAQPFGRIAFVGASGYLGKQTLAALAASRKHRITVISRTVSSANFPGYDDVVVRRGSYEDEAFMHSALRDQDVLIIMLNFLAMSEQDRLLLAASKAGVRFVIPSDYMMDSSNPDMCNAVPLTQNSRETQLRVQALGMKSIAVVCNLWLDFTLQRGISGIDVAKRQATICTDSAPYNTSTTAKVAAGVAALLALPSSTVETEFADSWLYVSSFRLTHEELLHAVLRSTGTTESDWNIERQSYQKLLSSGREKLAAGNRFGMVDLFCGSMFQPGLGGDYTAKVHNDLLGLPEEDLDTVIRNAVLAN